MKTTLQLILIGLLIMCFSSCYTEKKARQQIDKADTAFPGLLPDIARTRFPCTDLLRPDTITQVHDTVVYIECPEDPLGYKPTTRRPNDYTRIDTVRLPGSTRTVRVPVTLPVQVQYITKWYEDSAKLKLSALALTKSAERIQALEKQLADMTGSRAWYRRWFWWLIVAVVILGAFATYKIFK